MHDKRALTDHRFGGFSLLLAGAMFLAKSILESIAGDPSSTGQEIQVWRSSHELTLVWVDETFLAATVLLVPAVIALYRGLRGPDRPWVDFGRGVFAAVIPVNVVLLIVHGRLVFPVFGIGLDDPAVAALVVSLYAGGTHAVSLLLAGAAIMLSLAMRRTVFGPRAGVVGVIAGAAQLVVAYPWLISPAIVLICQALLAAWFILCGGRLAWHPSRPVPDRESPSQSSG
ncbi:hypothetical protein PV761_21060 [Arthrobacter sp. CC3]|uniref:hypothetical protein n=1 Tax=Arthrobacter sp. CC3 TaxID=3029185 RepID=UPI00326564D0